MIWKNALILKAPWYRYVPCAVTFKSLHFAHTLYFCVSYGKTNGDFFLNTELSDWLL
jgi:hypothetical protein